MKRRTIAHLLRKARRHPAGSPLHRSYKNQLLAEMHRGCPRHDVPDWIRPAPPLVLRAFGQRLQRRHRTYDAMRWFDPDPAPPSWSTMSSADILDDIQELCNLSTLSAPAL